MAETPRVIRDYIGASEADQMHALSTATKKRSEAEVEMLIQHGSDGLPPAWIAMGRLVHRQEVTASQSVFDVLELKEQHCSTWRDRDDNYWLQRLMQEVGELASVLAGNHDDTAEHELRQIAAIAMNWLEHRQD